MTPTREVLQILRRTLVRYRDEAEKAAKTAEGWKGDHLAEVSYWRGKAVGLVSAIAALDDMADAVEIEEEKELDDMADKYEKSEKDCLWEGEE